MDSSTASSIALVEAATALTELGVGNRGKTTLETKSEDDSKVLSSLGDTSNPSLVSDDDETQLQDAKLSNNKDVFPKRLHAILTDPSLSDIISWLPDGRSFVILRPDVLAETVLPRYMPPTEHGPRNNSGTVKYQSFTRKLNRWGFRQITRGPSTGAFHHELFVRGKTELCTDMVCQKSHKRKSKDFGSDPAAVSTPNSPSAKEESTIGSPSSSTSSSLSSSSLVRALPPKKRRLSTEPDVTGQGILIDAPSLRYNKPQPELHGAIATAITSNGPKTCSINSSDMDQSPSSSMCDYLLPTISNDANFVESVLRLRDERERMEVARSMLYNAFMEACNVTTKCMS